MSGITCSTCLSINRKLFQLDINKYKYLFGNKEVIQYVSSVCWECVYIFQKLYKFKLQVLRVQEYLKNTSPKVSDLEPLSHLTRSSFIFNDICCNIQNISQENIINHVKHTKTDLVQNIKSELYSDDSCDANESENYFITINNTKDDINTASNETHVNRNTASNETQVDITIKNEEEILSDDLSIRDISLSADKSKIKATRKSKTESNVKRKNIETEDIKHNKKRVKKGAKSKILTITKDNYTIIEMTEEEMQARRETDRQSDRYKNKVKYRCDWCIVGFFHKKLYDTHMRNRHSEKDSNYQCSICQTGFTKLKSFREHTASHYIKFKCKVCGYIGYKLSEMVSHDAKEHDVWRFICTVCKVGFPSAASIRFHRETTHEAPVKCELCTKSFTTKNGLRVHINQMHGGKALCTCAECGVRVRHVTSHMRRHRAPPARAYCAECDHSFSSAQSYHSHLKYSARHRSDTALRHACKLCDSKFVTPTGLKKHVIARHSTERPFKCDRCGKGYEAQCKLKRHIQYAHEGVEKPKDKICHICGRGFNTKFMLSNHIRVHTGEKLFRCVVCGAAFSQKSSLTTHTRGVHLKIKPRPGRGHLRASQST